MKLVLLFEPLHTYFKGPNLNMYLDLLNPQKDIYHETWKIKCRSFTKVLCY